MDRYSLFTFRDSLIISFFFITFYFANFNFKRLFLNFKSDLEKFETEEKDISYIQQEEINSCCYTSYGPYLENYYQTDNKSDCSDESIEHVEDLNKYKYLFDNL